MLNINNWIGLSVTVSACRRRLAGLIAVGALAALLLPGVSFAGAYDDFFRAVQQDNADEIRSLLQRGLDPNLIEASRGNSGLILAVQEGSMKVFDVLLNA